MKRLFPEPIMNLPRADIPLKGAHGFLSQGTNHQVLFIEYGSLWQNLRRVR